MSSRQIIYDICLLKTTEDISFNARVWPICLPDNLPAPNDGTYDKKCVVAGWGDTRCKLKKIKILGFHCMFTNFNLYNAIYFFTNCILEIFLGMFTSGIFLAARVPGLILSENSLQAYLGKT